MRRDRYVRGAFTEERHLHSIGSGDRQRCRVHYGWEVRSMLIAFVAVALVLYLLSEWAIWKT